MPAFSDLVRKGRKWIGLFALTVALPALVLGILAVAAFRGEEDRQTFQRRERQQQIARLLDADLSSWLLSLQGSPRAADGRLRLRFEGEQLQLPDWNVTFGHQAASRATALGGEEKRLWLDAQSVEAAGDLARARHDYEQLARRGGRVAQLTRLALLRLALRGGDRSGSERWLEAIRNADRTALTESGIPIAVAAGLLLAADPGNCPSTAFLTETLQGLSRGAWRLRSEQWIFYSAELGAAIRKCSPRDENLLRRSEATAARLRDLLDAHPRILGARRASSGSPTAAEARYLAELDAFLVLFPATLPEAGWLIEGPRLSERAASRLAELVVAEDFVGRVGRVTAAADFRLPSFPDLAIAFSDRDAGGFFSFKRQFFLYTRLVLVVVAALGLVFAYRAVRREMEIARLKADFVAAVSHEFRSPLAAILALLERLEAGRVRDEESLKRYHAVIRREVHRLSALVNGLLDFSRLERGGQKLQAEPSDLRGVVAEAIQSFRDLGFADRVQLVADGSSAPLEVTVDRAAIGRCLQNLIDNALKYSPAESAVRVRAGRENGSCFIEVSDRGPGIPVSEQRKIFEEFYRARTADAHNVKGAGLGLALVKRIMESHGGRVTVESEPGKGSLFRLVLPPAGEAGAL